MGGWVVVGRIFRQCASSIYRNVCPGGVRPLGVHKCVCTVLYGVAVISFYFFFFPPLFKTTEGVGFRIFESAPN